MEIYKATSKDIPILLELEKEFLAPYDLKGVTYEVNENPFSTVKILKADGKIVGFLDYWITFDSATICQIAIKKEERNKGYASFLLEDAIKDLKSKKVEFLTLEVRSENEGAIALYTKFDFKKITIKKGYYSNGDDAIYMMKGLI
ncbi:MAG: ribosomal protein S18-alanine N-acetyltransferase [Bacilli bacterium]